MKVNRICGQCLKPKSKKNFYTRGKYLMYLCKECESKRKKEYYQTIKELEFNQIIFGN
jgi:transposase-like protein